MTAKPRLLMIEDDEVHREMVHRMLDDRFDLVEAETGDEALDRLENGTFYCALLDNRLPDATGIELLPLLAGYALPVVLMSSLTTGTLVAQAQEAGCSHVIAKDEMTAGSVAEAIAAAVAARAATQSRTAPVDSG